jgi:hypothetical protein
MLSFNVFLFYINSDMIDGSLEELTKLIILLDKDPKKTRKQQNIVKKIREIRDTLQGSVLYAKLKKSIE